MQIVCPGCNAKFSFDEGKITGEGAKLRCGKCRAVFRVMRKAVTSAFPPDISNAGYRARIKVFVANESAAFCQAVQKVLASEPFDVTVFNDGLEAMKCIETEKPSAVLLDVALPTMYGFEICEEVRKNRLLDDVKLILVASIYDKTKYKRTPTSLYGADAYIEKHHIPDSLASLIKKLVDGGEGRKTSPDISEATGGFHEKFTADAAVEQSDVTEADRGNLSRDEMLPGTETTESSSLSSSVEHTENMAKARRLARIIVSDILLYNQDKVMEGIRAGNFYELLKDEIREGKALYSRRVPAAVAAESAFLNDAFEQLISRKRHEMGL